MRQSPARGGRCRPSFWFWGPCRVSRVRACLCAPRGPDSLAMALLGQGDAGDNSHLGTQGEDDTAERGRQHLRAPETLFCLSLPTQATKETCQGHLRPWAGYQ